MSPAVAQISGTIILRSCLGYDIRLRLRTEGGSLNTFGVTNRDLRRFRNRNNVNIFERISDVTVMWLEQSECGLLWENDRGGLQQDVSLLSQCVMRIALSLIHPVCHWASMCPLVHTMYDHCALASRICTQQSPPLELSLCFLQYCKSLQIVFFNLISIFLYFRGFLQVCLSLCTLPQFRMTDKYLIRLAFPSCLPSQPQLFSLQLDGGEESILMNPAPWRVCSYVWYASWHLIDFGGVRMFHSFWQLFRIASPTQL